MQALFRNTPLAALEHTAVFSQKRHELLAGNLANMDTPGYRSRDLSQSDFEDALAESIKAQNSPTSISPSQRMFASDGPRKASEQVIFHDNSDVSLETQVTEIAKNQHLHGLAITTMRSQFSLLQAAITERA
ncbi:MAG: flagellar basal body rod protein FlgB [Planctomycetota bacterium]